MKKQINIIWLIIFLIIAGSFGCARAPIRQEQRMEVISNPPGAKIELNNDYLCDAPCFIDVWRTRPNEAYSSFPMIIIRAIPIRGGNFVQRKMIFDGDSLPKRLYFDMGIGPVPETVIEVK